MLLQLLRIKIQQLVVTESSENYPGSIALPDELIEASGLKLFEQVHVNNITNGNRIITYVIRSKKDGVVSVNGAASRKFNKGDKIHVLAFGYFDKETEAQDFQPMIVHANENNKLKDVKKYTF
ncbi:MAG TPA: aspartate 1-decarboxylase [Hanamia sp.]|nr:aspartate 1-decarboxylase [Hanamia sp.]